MIGLSLAERLVQEHFATLREMDALELADGYSRILKPDPAVAAALLGGGAARWRHVNFFTFQALFRTAGQILDKPLILETGSSAHGTNSSMLLASLAEGADGQFDSVDINPQTTQRLVQQLSARFGPSPRLRAHTGDSVTFIQGFGGRANLVYLDSYDLNAHDFAGSARHGLAEFQALLPKLDSTALILIDDTPCSREIFRKMTPPDYLAAVDRHAAAHGRLPGKGELIAEAVRADSRFQILAWEYQLLLRYDA